MEKELTPLEAWKELKTQIAGAQFCRLDLNGGTPQITTMLIRDTGLFEIIERALNRLEFLEEADNSFTFFFGGREAGKTAFTMSIFNRLKALEIIKEKRVDTYWLRTAENLSRYNLGVGTNQALKKKEYDLLKEVICDDSGTIKTEAR